MRSIYLLGVSLRGRRSKGKGRELGRETTREGGGGRGTTTN